MVANELGYYLTKRKMLAQKAQIVEFFFFSTLTLTKLVNGKADCADEQETNNTITGTRRVII